MCGKGVRLRAGLNPGFESAAGGNFWQMSPCLGLAFELSTLQYHSCVMTLSEIKAGLCQELQKHMVKTSLLRSLILNKKTW